jgi:hypothetical protein
LKNWPYSKKDLSDYEHRHCRYWVPTVNYRLYWMKNTCKPELRHSKRGREDGKKERKKE